MGASALTTPPQLGCTRLPVSVVSILIGRRLDTTTRRPLLVMNASASSDPIRQKLDELIRRPQPHLRRRETVFRSDQDAQASAVQDAERVLIGGVITQISYRDIRIQLGQETAHRVALICRRKTNLDTFLKFSQH